MSRVPGIVGRLIARQRTPAAAMAAPDPEPAAADTAALEARDLLLAAESLSYNELHAQARPVLGDAMPSPRPRAAILKALEALAARDQ